MWIFAYVFVFVHVAWILKLLGSRHTTWWQIGLSQHVIFASLWVVTWICFMWHCHVAQSFIRVCRRLAYHMKRPNRKYASIRFHNTTCSVIFIGKQKTEHLFRIYPIYVTKFRVYCILMRAWRDRHIPTSVSHSHATNANPLVGASFVLPHRQSVPYNLLVLLQVDSMIARWKLGPRAVSRVLPPCPLSYL
jgi:hypothetical protein